MDIEKALSKLGITALNEMQQHTAEAILGSDGDVVLLSPTGTGKTPSAAAGQRQRTGAGIGHHPGTRVGTPVRSSAQEHGLWHPFHRLLRRKDGHGRA